MKTTVLLSGAGMCLILLGGCGGGDSSEPTTPSTTLASQTEAAYSPLVGETFTIAKTINVNAGERWEIESLPDNHLQYLGQTQWEIGALPAIQLQNLGQVWHTDPQIKINGQLVTGLQFKALSKGEGDLVLVRYNASSNVANLKDTYRIVVR